ncbi:uncharacterized protein L969DRAFT_97384 [Mixia osmundae IAM 14324]|uniref:Nicotinate phosphoribosyltransferase n=1 Tax=Mixia osmundae (strain CBS 9802 / IAM 14324 / JCM 22182 / KY 12970) TaxID=764103 RepID=G7DUN3_MIXOS|nr:uncharacterized protein L969DRAFT_97384 [Mixia osmundae IAM 14324]KEI36375.1 hypothetical protein L969DRAFT_97384 [Mixia osmundae IAM 14324]GAA94293.1 hypothetical protein E5Q_00942 [Mixia osmundae IAM 14324]
MTMADYPVSLIDTDLYKLTMSQFVYRLYPDVQVSYKFTNRTSDRTFTKQAFAWIEDKINALESLRLTTEEKGWLSRLPFFQSDYLDWLATFQLRPREQIKLAWQPISNSDKGAIDLEIRGTWLDTILYEVPIISIISQGYFLHVDKDWDLVGQKALAYSKAERLIKNGCIFSDFGARRRRSYQSQEIVLRGLMAAQADLQDKGFKGKFSGCSNAHFAHKLGLTPVGTLAHELFMAIGAMQGLEKANTLVLEQWETVYPNGQLSIALTDTFTSAAFFEAFVGEPARVQRWTGLRQDSGDPFAFIPLAIEAYRKADIDFSNKVIVFSDSLDIDKAVRLQKASEEAGIRCSFGIGTYFTNDFVAVASDSRDPASYGEGNIRQGEPSTALNIVIKLATADGKPCVKISDETSKITGTAEAVEAAKRLCSRLPERSSLSLHEPTTPAEKIIREALLPTAPRKGRTGLSAKEASQTAGVSPSSVHQSGETVEIVAYAGSEQSAEEQRNVSLKRIVNLIRRDRVDSGTSSETSAISALTNRERLIISKWLYEVDVRPASGGWLRVPHEARWLANRMFSRLAARCASAHDNRSRSSALWLLATACLSLSCKFILDFSEPLVSLELRWFATICPAANTRMHHLAVIERELLALGGYAILTQPTPQAYGDEIYNTVPELQQLSLTQASVWSSIGRRFHHNIRLFTHDAGFSSTTVGQMTLVALIEASADQAPDLISLRSSLLGVIPLAQDELDSGMRTKLFFGAAQLTLRDQRHVQQEDVAASMGSYSLLSTSLSSEKSPGSHTNGYSPSHSVRLSPTASRDPTTLPAKVVRLVLGSYGPLLASAYVAASAHSSLAIYKGASLLGYHFLFRQGCDVYKLLFPWLLVASVPAVFVQVYMAYSSTTDEQQRGLVLLKDIVLSLISWRVALAGILKAIWLASSIFAATRLDFPTWISFKALSVCLVISLRSHRENFEAGNGYRDVTRATKTIVLLVGALTVSLLLVSRVYAGGTFLALCAACCEAASILLLNGESQCVGRRPFSFVPFVLGFGIVVAALRIHGMQAYNREIADGPHAYLADRNVPVLADLQQWASLEVGLFVLLAPLAVIAAWPAATVLPANAYAIVISALQHALPSSVSTQLAGLLVIAQALPVYTVLVTSFSQMPKTPNASEEFLDFGERPARQTRLEQASSIASATRQRLLVLLDSARSVLASGPSQQLWPALATLLIAALLPVALWTTRAWVNGYDDSLDVVVAYYDEPLDRIHVLWAALNAAPAIYLRNPKLHLYVKAPDANLTALAMEYHPHKLQQLENRGREGGTYLSHILQHYDATERWLNPDIPRSRSAQHSGAMAKHTIFLQAHLGWNNMAGARFALLRQNTRFMSFGPYIEMKDGVEGYLGNGLEIPGFDDIYQIFVGHGWQGGSSQLASWSAQVVASREAIMRNAQSAYKKILSQVTADHASPDIQVPPWWDHKKGDPSDPWFGHAVERAWPIIFGCDEYQIAFDCDFEASDPALCACYDGPRYQ